jgi:hypothetical protein
LGLEGFAKIGAILLRKVEEAFLEILTKTKGKILAFAEKWGLTEIYTLVKTQIGKIFDPLISTASKLLEPVLTKISGIFAVVGTHAGNVGGLFNKVGGILTVFADRLIWAGLIVDVIKWISDSLLEWINDPFWRTVLIYISNLTAVMSPLIDVIGWIWDAFSDLFHILTTGKLEFNNLFARFREVGEAFRVFVGTTRSILSGIGVLGGARANGGPVNGGQSYLVGEKGPEIFTPGTGGSITPNNKMGGGASIGNINITINTSKIDSSNLNQLSKEISDKIYADVRRRVTF